MALVSCPACRKIKSTSSCSCPWCGSSSFVRDEPEPRGRNEGFDEDDDGEAEDGSSFAEALLRALGGRR